MRPTQRPTNQYSDGEELKRERKSQDRMMRVCGKTPDNIGAIHAGDNEIIIGHSHTVLGFISFPSWFSLPSSVSFLASNTYGKSCVMRGNEERVVAGGVFRLEAVVLCVLLV